MSSNSNASITNVCLRALSNVAIKFYFEVKLSIFMASSFSLPPMNLNRNTNEQILYGTARAVVFPITSCLCFSSRVAGVARAPESS